MKSLRTSALIGTFLSLVMIAACDGPPEAPESLQSIEVPADFDFATSRAVTLTVSSRPELLPRGAARLEVVKLDGRLLYSGALSPHRPTVVTLPVPTKDEELQLKLQVGGETLTERLSLGEGDVLHIF